MELVRHQLASFDHFVDNISKVTTHVEPIKLNKGRTTVSFVRMELEPPLLTPQEARLRELTYAGRLFGTIQVAHATGRSSWEDSQKRLLLGMIPIMLRSKLCLTTKAGETPPPTETQNGDGAQTTRKRGKVNRKEVATDGEGNGDKRSDEDDDCEIVGEGVNAGDPRGSKKLKIEETEDGEMGLPPNGVGGAAETLNAQEAKEEEVEEGDVGNPFDREWWEKCRKAFEQEGSSDPGGYFIINGKERAWVLKEYEAFNEIVLSQLPTKKTSSQTAKSSSGIFQAKVMSAVINDDFGYSGMRRVHGIQERLRDA
eukprot:TRINITY_DN6405_c0_g1_i1.p1 TRINITY_DN6405_c0_g1~~TRINITY_DN6405_c0_g1_i1.p1  ORF type:complete len:312 (-),score=65.04 TRINITY_DN6405_c0_g1_i1:708-1643(-)